MANATDDTSEMTVDWSAPPTQPPSIDPAVLRRAMKFGQLARLRYHTRTFREVEDALHREWFKKGEATEWEWVRAAVRAGYEADLPDDE
jgi:hypothetical protein